MSEERITIPREQNTSSSPPAKKTALIYHLYNIWIGLSIIAVIVYYASYTSYFAWQLLANAGAVLVALVIILISRAVHQRGRQNIAEILFGSAIFVIYTSTELFWAGHTTFNLLGGLLLLTLAAYVIKPKNGEAWLIIGVLLIITILVINQLAPIERFDITNTTALRYFIPSATILFVLLISWQLVILLQTDTTIKTRLLISFIALSFLPVLITSLISLVIGTRFSEQQIVNQLQTQGEIKTLQIENWLQELHNGLNNILRVEGTALDYYRLISSPLSEISVQNARQLIQADFETAMQDHPEFEVLMVISNNGTVVAATQPELEGVDLSTRDYFLYGSISQYTQPLQAANTGNNFFFIARPIHSASGIVIGTLAARVTPTTLNQIIADHSNLGETGEAYMINSELILLTDSLGNDFTLGQSRIDTLGPRTVRDSKLIGEGTYSNHRGDDVVGVFQWLPALDAGFIVEQTQSEAFQAIRINLSLNILAAILAVGLAIAIGLIITQGISGPIVALAETASLFASGELDHIEPLDRNDEIGELSQALNKMTTQINEHLHNLENLVAERTQHLETRARYMQAAAEVGRAATEIYRQDELLMAVTHLISERFGFYHVGIFLLDEAKEYAVLQATNSEGGWRMLARGHRLRVNEQGIVGYVTGTHKPRIQQSVDSGGVYYHNPDLPLTRSEMALPLIFSGELLGALDVQSTQENAFDEEDISVLQVLADQVAMAIGNSMLFEQLQTSLESERRVYGELSQQAWQEILGSKRSRIAVRSDKSGVQFVDAKWQAVSREAMQSGHTVQHNQTQDGDYPLAVPIKVRGDVIAAVFETKKSAEDGPWTSQEIDVIEAVAEQLGIALENARLFEETQRLAQRERVAAEVAGKVWASSNVNTILQTAVQELGRALNASQGVIRLKLPDESGNGDGHTLELGDMKND